MEWIVSVSESAMRPTQSEDKVKLHGPLESSDVQQRDDALLMARWGRLVKNEVRSSICLQTRFIYTGRSAMEACNISALSDATRLELDAVE